MRQPLVAKRARIRRGILSTRVVTLLGRTAAHPRRTACRNSGRVEVGSSMSRVHNLIWSQTYSMGFRYGLPAGQPMNSTSCSARKTAVSRAVWGVALSWTYNFRPETPVAQVNTPSRKTLLALTSSLLPSWWVPHTMIQGPWLPSMGWMHTSIRPSPCLRRTQARPSL